MGEDLEVRLVLRADNKGVKAEIKSVEGALAGAGKAGKKAGDDIGRGARTAKDELSKTERVSKSLSGQLNKLSLALSAYLTVGTAIKALKMADEWNTLQQRIKTATKETGDYNQVSQELYEIAQRNGSAMSDTVDTFQRLAIARKELGATNAELLKVTEAVQGLGRVSGATQQGMAAGMLQFAQALGAGTVRAEELNSIIENMPAVADRIARGMGMTTAQLRQAVLAGEVLSRDVFESLLKQSEAINMEVGEVPLNMEQSWNVATQALSRFLGQLDKAYGLTQLIAKGLQNLAGNLNEAANRLGLTNEGRYNELIEERLELQTKIAELEDSPRVRNRSAKLYELRRQLAEVNAEAKKLIDLNVASIIAGDPANKPAGAPPPPPKPKKTRTDPNETAVKSLEREAALLGLTAQQAALYTLQLEGASKAQLERARVALEAIEAEEEFERAVKASEEAVKAENQAYQEWNQSLDEAARAIKDTLDPLEPLRRELELLNVLLNAGKLTWDEWSEATLNVQERMDAMQGKTEETNKELNQFAVQAARNIQGAFADFLFDQFQDGLDGMLYGFVQTLHRMAAEALSQQILSSLFGALSGSGGATGSFFGSLAASLKHSGGIAGELGQTRYVHPAVFADAKRLHTGGLAANEVPAILQENEEVLTASDPRHRNNGGLKGVQSSVTVVLQDDRGSVGEYMASAEGEQVFIENIRRNAGSIRRILSD